MDSPAPAGSSRRERQLWGWTLAVVAAVYASLVWARALADVLRERNLLDATFAAGLLLAVAGVVALAVRARPGGAEIGVGLVVGAAYLMTFARIAIPEERTHLVEYGVIAVLSHEALAERARNGRRVPAPALLAVAAATVLGIVDEGIQWVLPGRVFDPADMAVNVLAAVLAVTALLALRWAKRHRRG